MLRCRGPCFSGFHHCSAPVPQRCFGAAQWRTCSAPADTRARLQSGCGSCPLRPLLLLLPPLGDLMGRVGRREAIPVHAWSGERSRGGLQPEGGQRPPVTIQQHGRGRGAELGFRPAWSRTVRGWETFAPQRGRVSSPGRNRLGLE